MPWRTNHLPNIYWTHTILYYNIPQHIPNDMEGRVLVVDGHGVLLLLAAGRQLPDRDDELLLLVQLLLQRQRQGARLDLGREGVQSLDIKIFIWIMNNIGWFVRTWDFLPSLSRSSTAALVTLRMLRLNSRTSASLLVISSSSCTGSPSAMPIS